VERARCAELSKLVMLDFVQMKSFCEDPLVVERAEGVRVWDTEGRGYIDGLSGIYVVNVGHGRPEIVEAMKAQLDRIAFAPQMATNPPALELAELLIRITPEQYTRVKFHSGGSEATEAAIKLARQYHRQSGSPGRYKVLSHYRGYHGATGNSLAATGWPHLRAPFEPFPTGFIRLHTPDPYRPLFPGTPEQIGATYARLADETIRMEGPSTVAAIIVEPVMMSAGIIVPPPGYLAGLREVADRHGVLLILDEVITGFGRTGKLFAREHSGVFPDLFCVGKGMSGGYAPLSAVVLSERIADAFWGEPSESVQFHAGHTFAGNPLACAAGVAAVRVLIESGALENGARVGAYAKRRLQELQARHEAIGDVRGEGMLLGLEFVRDRQSRERFADDVGFGLRVQAEARQRGLLLRCSAWFAAVGPPLTTTAAEVDEIVSILDASIGAVEASLGRVPAAAGR
jgi:adenosylmethionine-8-amino-7-oxononanoate aminotransferase